MKRISLLTVLLVAIISKSSAQTESILNQPYVEVNGYADTLVVPDEIYISITISENDNKKLSVEEQERKMVAALKSLSIPVEKDLSTSDMLSNFKSRFLQSKDIVKTKSYQLEVHNAMTAGKVFASLEDIGIANSSISKVDYSDMDNLKNVCRIKAIENAKTTAAALVKPLGQAVGKAIQIIDAGNNSPIYTPQIRMYALAKADTEDAPNIDFEKIKVSATEDVKFILN